MPKLPRGAASFGGLEHTPKQVVGLYMHEQILSWRNVAGQSIAIAGGRREMLIMVEQDG